MSEQRAFPCNSFPCNLVLKTMVRQVVPLQSMEVHGGADIYLQPLDGTPHQSRWIPERGCDPVGTLCWNRLRAGPADPWREEPMMEQVCWQGL